MKITNLILLILLLIISTYSQWNVDTIGIGILSGNTPPFDVAVGDGRNDGINRLYVSSKNGELTEFTYDNGSWEYVEVVPYIRNLGLIAVGNGRGDGVSRVYWSEFMGAVGSVLEASWNGSGWEIDTIDKGVQSLSIFIGPGRNDGRNRVYAGTFGTSAGLWEYTYDNGNWDALRITTQGMEGSGAIGDLRNDGVQRILSNANDLQELTWNGTTYNSVAINSDDTWPDPTDIGYGRNDNLIRAYINSSLGRVEYSYSNGSWRENIIDNTSQRGDVYLARLKSDGLYRLYTTFSLNPKRKIREYEWSSGAFSMDSTTLDGLTGATAQLTSGNGRNDGIERLYTPNWAGGYIYEVTATNPWADTSSTPISNKYINTQKGKLGDKFKGNVNVSLFTISGRLIEEKEFEIKDKIMPNLIFPNQSAGIYLFKITKGMNCLSRRVVIK